MNIIDHIRKQTSDQLGNAPEGSADTERFISPGGNYTLLAMHYVWSEKRPGMDVGTIWRISRVEISDNRTSELLFSFLVNEAQVFHSWIIKNDIEYLLCAEDLCGGQTVIDLTNRKMVSYTEAEDGFIWTKHLLSPDETMLAVFGCGWGSPFFILIYDFTNPMELPLKVIKEPGWTGHDMIEWVGNAQIKVVEDDKSKPFVIDL